MNDHRKLLEKIAIKIVSLSTNHVQRVGIDGVDGAGKTTFANDLAPIIEDLGRIVIRASVDGFHNPREVRYKNGKGPTEFFNDSYNYPELKEVLLDPLSPSGNKQYTPAIFNVDKDQLVPRVKKVAGPSDILLFDGIFLHRPELRNYWDFSIFLDVAFEESIPRGAQRGTGSPDVLAASNIRYVEGQKIYLTKCEPQKFATVHIDYNDILSPRILRMN